MENEEKKRILVVDDEPIALKMCEYVLNNEGFAVVTANSGRECLDYLRGEYAPKIDLILLDIEMPVLNGYTTLSTIRQNDMIKDIPVIFLTATATQQTVQAAIKLGVRDYIKKPFDPMELIAKIKSALNPEESTEDSEETDDE